MTISDKKKSHDTVLSSFALSMKAWATIYVSEHCTVNQITWNEGEGGGADTAPQSGDSEACE